MLFQYKMEQNNNHYKWTKGEPYEKSSKTQKKELSTATICIGNGRNE